MLAVQSFFDRLREDAAEAASELAASQLSQGIADTGADADAR
jgi:hypothetical protein